MYHQQLTNFSCNHDDDADNDEVGTNYDFYIWQYLFKHRKCRIIYIHNKTKYDLAVLFKSVSIMNNALKG